MSRRGALLFGMLSRGSRFGACCDAYTGVASTRPHRYVEARNFAERWHFEVSRERLVGQFTFLIIQSLFWRDVVRPGRRHLSVASRRHLERAPKFSSPPTLLAQTNKSGKQKKEQPKNSVRMRETRLPTSLHRRRYLI